MGGARFWDAPARSAVWGSGPGGDASATLGEGIVATTSRKTKNEDPLPFLRKPSSKHQAMGPMDKIFQQERRDELDLTIGFFFLSQLHIL
jgi:hypothetical protein